MEAPRFIVDQNVGKLVRWLRMMGYDSLYFGGADDNDMITTALAEDRIILTRDTRIMQRRLVTSGQLKALLIDYERSQEQIRQVIARFKLDTNYRPFSRCLECNRSLVERTKEEVEWKVPPYVFKTQQQYMQCPACNRIYWRGSHWQAMTYRLEQLAALPGKED